MNYSPRVRNILEVEVDVNSESLWIFVNHWKSRAYHGVESKRMKYAKVLKRRLDALSKSSILTSPLFTIANRTSLAPESH